jgi:uncharacterized membrane protein
MTEIKKKTVTGLPENSEAAAAYVLGWVSGLILLLVEKNSKKVKYHAIQSLVLFGALNVLQIIWGMLVASMFMSGLTFFSSFALSPIIGILVFVLWLVLIVKTYQGEEIKIPIISDFVKNQIK